MADKIFIGLVNNNNLSCGSCNIYYPYGLLMFGENFTKYEYELTNIELYISDNSSEGEELNNMLKKKEDIINIKDFLFRIIIENITYKELYDYIEQKNKESYKKGLEEGKREKIKEIRKVLEL